MSSKLITSRRTILKTMGALSSAAAITGCADEQAVSQQEDEIFGCFFSDRDDNAMKKRGVFGEIEHVVVLMMENRSFDQYFGARSIATDAVDYYGNTFGGEGRTDVNGLVGDEFNLDLDGNPVYVNRLTESVYGDIAHEWEDCHRQLDWANTGQALNDGFVRQHEQDMLWPKEDDKIEQEYISYCKSGKYFGENAGCPEKQVPMGVYAREDLPVSWALADNYTLCDNWYSSVCGPTWPNRFYLHAGSSRGETGNKPVLGMRTIWEKMREQCMPVLNYYCDLPWAHVVGEGAVILGSELGDGIFGGILEQFHSSQKGWGSFYNDVQNDDLPAYSLIDPGFSSGYDDHPPADTKMGQAFISYVYRILASNPKVWAKTLFIITYDEHGSFYDHVIPPGEGATNADGSPAGNNFDEYPEFRQLGFRVPSLVIGPHVKKGHVSHDLLDHVSVLSTLYDRFDLSANGVGHLNDRVKNTSTLADCIDQGITGSNTPAPVDIPVLEFSESEIMDWTGVPFPDGQVGLAEMAQRGEIPREQDLRRFRQQNMLEFLQLGEELGALKITQ
jgi:phospholipase C